MPGKQTPASDEIVEGTVIDDTAPPAKQPRATNRLVYGGLAALVVGGLSFLVWQERETARDEMVALADNVAGLQGQITAQATQIATLQQQLKGADTARAQLTTRLDTEQTATAQVLADRVTTAEEFAALQQNMRAELDQLGAQLAQIPAPAPAAAADTPSDEFSGEGKGGSDAGASSDTGETVPALPGDQAQRATLTVPPVAHLALIAQTELVLMNGIMLQNQTGQSLTHWREMITDLIAAGAPASTWSPVQMAIAADPPRTAALLVDGAGILRARTDMLHQTKDDASTLDRVLTSLRRFVHLRPADGASGDAGSDITQFEDAIRDADLAMAVAVAGAWPTDLPPGSATGSATDVTAWQEAATARIALDRAVSQGSADIIRRLAMATAREEMN